MLIMHQVHAAAQGWKVKHRHSARNENFNQETHNNNLSKKPISLPVISNPASGEKSAEGFFTEVALSYFISLFPKT
jgi:hypothetical protein